MKRFIYNSRLSYLLTIAGTVAINLLLCSNSIFAQDDEEEDEIPERLKYVREKYDETYDASFDVVWNAVKSFIEENSCRILNEKVKDKEDGTQRGICQSENCVLTTDLKLTFKTMGKYGLEPPFIRGGKWTSIRVQYKFIVNQLSDGKVNVLVTTDFSGFEDLITQKVHFFNTNGLIEFELFEKLKEKIK